MEPFNQEKRYEFEVKNLPQNTQILIEKKRFDNPILIAYFNFLELGKNAISPDGKRLILTIFELYLFVFISSLKRFVGRNHVDITTIEDYFRNDFEKEFVINPFLILVRRYLEFFFQTKQKHDKTIKTLLFLLQDFTINDYIQTSVLSNSNRLNNQINNNNFANRQKVPKPHVFQVVFLVVHYFHKHNADSDVRKTDFLMNSGFFAKSLYHFFINVLEAWNYDISNNSSLLSDLGNVWLQFLKPWEITETYSLINYLNLLDEGTISENNDFGAIFQENKVSKEMYKRENVQYISHFLKENVLFYTHVLKQFLITLSDQNEIHFKDFVFLKNMLDFLLGTTNLKSQINSLINGFINVNWIKQLSTGGNVKIEGSLDVMQYLDFMGAKLDNLNLFADESIVSRALNIITNSKRFLVTFKQKVFYIFNFLNLNILIKSNKITFNIKEKVERVLF